MLRSRSLDARGVSPVIGVILMVALAVVLAGVVFIIVYGFLENDEENNFEKYIFEVELDGTNDQMTISFLKGDTLSATTLTVYIDNIVVPIPAQEFRVGEGLTIDTPIDMVPGNEYNIRIVVQTQLYFDQDLIAAP